MELKNTFKDKYTLIDIIAGNTDLKTLFAKLNSLAIESSIAIEKIKPIVLVSFENKNLNVPNNEIGQESSKNDDPLITPDNQGRGEVPTESFCFTSEKAIEVIKNIEQIRIIFLNDI